MLKTKRIILTTRNIISTFMTALNYKINYYSTIKQKTYLMSHLEVITINQAQKIKRKGLFYSELLLMDLSFKFPFLITTVKRNREHIGRR